MEIQDEIKCPICLKYLTDPVSIHCGHNFCRVCITQYYETWAEGDYDPVRCPNCRALIQKGTLRPNWQLANIVNKIKHMDLKPGKEKLCKRHNKTLDLFYPDTAHPVLVLSDDQKSVRWGDTRQDLPDNPERFDTELCVLGCEGFTSGKHSWEVEEVDEGHWAVGVARESVRRKGVISRNPQGGIWAVGPWGDQFKALTSMETPLPLSWVPKRIQIFLDYEKGQVTFFDVDKEAPIFTFPPRFQCNCSLIHPSAVPPGHLLKWFLCPSISSLGQRPASHSLQTECFKISGSLSYTAVAPASQAA
uniref:Uncharacterized protein n=1 Tax=Chelonoidis abingdonii TaxID=106734 RepID=A0A8C0J3V5_CHEAB